MDGKLILNQRYHWIGFFFCSLDVTSITLLKELKNSNSFFSAINIKVCSGCEAMILVKTCEIKVLFSKESSLPVVFVFIAMTIQYLG
jgi:hypothetical protein